MRTLATPAFCLVLAGCFSSEAPLFDEARGQCPFETPTAYVELDEMTPERWIFAADGAYCTRTRQGGAAERALFVPMERDWWIVQSQEAEPTYALVNRVGDRLVQYFPRCADFTDLQLARLGVVYDEDQNACRVNDASQIETLFRAWRRSDHGPAGEYVRDGA